jgi:hypothetical protein
VLRPLQATRALQELLVLVLALATATAMAMVLLRLCLSCLLGPGCTAAGSQLLGLKEPETATPLVWGQL